jgi:1,2-diacylglycerol 3-beta-glucosyltransferase
VPYTSITFRSFLPMEETPAPNDLDGSVLGISLFLILGSLSYTVAIFGLSRRRKVNAVRPPDDLLFVFLVPCLNEEVVIEASLRRLLSLEGGEAVALVIDDGSDDRTAEIVRSVGRSDEGGDRVWLLQRVAPNARQGKGEALNHALRHLKESGLLEGRDPRDVILCVVDADGRLAPHTLTEVGPYFVDREVGAVQIGVRMYNAEKGLVARMQDFEFVTFTELFQRARQRLGSVGLGGNGQFARLAALDSLGSDPWTECLTEDLDLGLRLLVAGWRNDFCRTAHVSQQAVTQPGRLLRQRTRWFQGHLQCWSRVPMVLRSRLSGRAVFDLTFHLLSPSLVLAMTFPMIAFALRLVAATIAAPTEVVSLMGADRGMVLLGWYVLSFGAASLYGFVYWLRNDDMSLWRSIAYGHAYSLYSYMWLLAGWKAVWRIVTRRNGWAKTARTASSEALDAPGAADATAGAA